MIDSLGSTTPSPAPSQSGARLTSYRTNFEKIAPTSSKVKAHTTRPFLDHFPSSWTVFHTLSHARSPHPLGVIFPPLHPSTWTPHRISASTRTTVRYYESHRACRQLWHHVTYPIEKTRQKKGRSSLTSKAAELYGILHDRFKKRKISLQKALTRMHGPLDSIKYSESTANKMEEIH